MTFPKLITLSFLSILLLNCSSSKELKVIKKEYNGNYLESEHISAGGSPSSLYKSFHSLFNKLNKDEKKHLALHGKPTAKTYASLYFIKPENKEDLIEIFKHNIKDHQVVTYLNGCVERDTETNVIIYNEVLSLIELKKDTTFDKNSRKYVNGLKSTIENLKKKNIQREDFIEYANEKIKQLEALMSWKLKDLITLKENLEQITLNDSNASEKLKKAFQK